MSKDMGWTHGPGPGLGPPGICQAQPGIYQAQPGICQAKWHSKCLAWSDPPSPRAWGEDDVGKNKLLPQITSTSPRAGPQNT